MSNRSSADVLVNLLLTYYRNELQVLNVNLEEVCFCPNNPECTVKDLSPIAIPTIEANKLKIHINSETVSSWYPAQIVFQLSHELWHAYEFSRYGIAYPWRNFEKDGEPYAHAASLCVLSDTIIPERFLSIEQQKRYFDAQKLDISVRSIYRPGIKIARDVNYNFRELCNTYNAEVAPLIQRV